MHDAVTFSFRFILFALIHSFLASDASKKFCDTYLPTSMQRYYRLLYNLFSLLLFVWVMAIYPMPAVLYFFPGVWSLVCNALQLAVFVLLFRCAAQTGLAALLGLHQPTVTELCTSGCYAQVRHPLYTLSVLFLALNPVMTVKWLLLTILSSAYFVMGAIIEERRLEKEFGDVYRNYRRHVPMFVPQLTRGGKHRAS